MFCWSKFKKLVSLLLIIVNCNVAGLSSKALEYPSVLIDSIKDFNWEKWVELLFLILGFICIKAINNFSFLFKLQIHSNPRIIVNRVNIRDQNKTLREKKCCTSFNSIYKSFLFCLPWSSLCDYGNNKLLCNWFLDFTLVSEVIANTFPFEGWL